MNETTEAEISAFIFNEALYVKLLHISESKILEIPQKIWSLDAAKISSRKNSSQGRQKIGNHSL